MQVTSQSHSSVVGQTVGVPAHHGHAVPAHAPAVAHAHAAVPAPAPAHHAGHAGHALGKRDADADADAQLVGPDHFMMMMMTIRWVRPMVTSSAQVLLLSAMLNLSAMRW